MLRLSARLMICIDASNFVEAGIHQTELEGFLRILRERYPEAVLEFTNVANGSRSACEAKRLQRSDSSPSGPAEVSAEVSLLRGPRARGCAD